MVDDTSHMDQQPKPPLPFEPSEESVKVGSLSDLPSTIDRLGFEPYVEAVAQFLTSPDTNPPLTISIEGKWGSGKTSFMNQLEEKLKENCALTVKFNAWRHDGEKSLWAAFALALLDQLPNHECLASTPKARRARRRKGHWKLLRMRFKWKSAWRDALPTILGGVAAVFATIFLTIIAIKKVSGVLPTLSGIAGSSASAAIILQLLKKVVGKIGNPMDIDLNKYMSRPDYEGHTSFIENFQNDFQKIIEAYAGDAPVYAFIDDVDRCQLPKAAELMKALNLMLSSNAKIIFIIGMDREKVAAGLASDYVDVMPYLLYKKGDIDPRKKGEIYPEHAIRHAYEFIEKFIQLHFQIPKPEGERLSEFVKRMGKPEETPESPAAAKTTPGFLSAKWSALVDRFRPSKQKSPQEGSVIPATSDDSGVGLTDAGGEAVPIQTEEEKKKEQRRETIRLELGKDSETVTNLALLFAPYFDNNPRRIIQFLNLFRLRAYIANETGLFDVVGDIDYAKLLTFEKLGKFVALSLKWPLLISKLYDKPDLLHDLQHYTLPDIEMPKNVPTDVKKWLEEDDLVDFLREGCVSEKGRLDPEGHSKYSLQLLNVRDLLKVSPAVPRSEVEPPSPDVPPTVPGEEVVPSPIKDIDEIDESDVEVTPESQVGSVSKYQNEIAEYYKKGGIAEEEGDLDTAGDLYRKILEMEQEEANTEGQAECLYRIGTVYRKQRRLEEALKVYYDSGALYKGIDNHKGQADMLSNIAGMHNAMGQFDKALKSSQEALMIHAELDDSEGQARDFSNIGLVLQNQGDLEGGLAQHRRSLEIREKIGDIRGQANSHLHMGNIYSQMSAWKEALSHAQSSQELYSKEGNVLGEAHALRNIGSALLTLNQPKESLYSLEKALQLYKKIGDAYGELNALAALGLVYATQKDYKKGLDLKQNALAIAERLGDRSAMATILFDMGNIYMAQGENDKTLEYLKKALSIYTDIGGQADIVEKIVATIEELEKPSLDPNDLEDTELTTQDKLRDFFTRIDKHFVPDKARGMSATYQWVITGEGGFEYYVTIENGQITSTGRGSHRDPTITITISGNDWVDIIERKLEEQMAFMSGKLRVRGDMSLVIKMADIFGLKST